LYGEKPQNDGEMRSFSVKAFAGENLSARREQFATGKPAIGLAP
jgi:hypothetical protein